MYVYIYIYIYMITSFLYHLPLHRTETVSFMATIPGCRTLRPLYLSSSSFKAENVMDGLIFIDVRGEKPQEFLCTILSNC